MSFSSFLGQSKEILEKLDTGCAKLSRIGGGGFVYLGESPH